MTFSGATRFQPEAQASFQAFKSAAISYIANLSPFDRRGLYEKPLDWRRQHPSYFNAMYQLLNALGLLNLEKKARIVEVGSGAGWATEIMASLRYRVDCVEPSMEMIKVARSRVLSHLKHHRGQRLYKNVSWQCATMEEAKLTHGSADAVMFFESFHHLIDEHVAIQQTWDVLKPGGQLIIVGDSNWIPGLVDQEQAWAQETALHGTLESPFTADYLLWLLRRRGFVGVKRHHSVNLLVPVDREDEPVRNFAQLDAKWVNLVHARKPVGAARRHTVKTIKLMADYDCHPLWSVSPVETGEVNPTDLPLSDALKADLSDWADVYDATLDRDDPVRSGFQDEDQRNRFVLRGERLAQRLREELGPDYTIVVQV